METITKTITLTLTPDDIDTIVETLFENNGVYDPWDSNFMRNLHEDLRIYCDDDYNTKAFLEDLETAPKLLKAVAARIGERYKEKINQAVSASL